MKTEAELSREQALADARYATAGRLVRGAVHDIKNPTGFVSGNVTYLRQVGGQIAEHLEALRPHLGPYASPGELREAVLRLLEVVDREGPELEACLDECDQGLRQLDDYSRALSRAAHDPGPVESLVLSVVVAEAVESARLFGRHIARIELQVEDHPIEQPRCGLGTLLTALLVDALEGCGRRATGFHVTVRYDGGLVIEDDATARPLPARASILAESLGLKLQREHAAGANVTRVLGL